MSLAKINHVQKAAKDPGPCGARGCDVVLKKGDPYLWYKVGFRSRYKNVRCVDHPPRQSERESSMLADVYAAIESFEDGTYESVEDLASGVQEVADAIREVADQYQQASEDQNGTTFNTEAAERAEVLESAADGLDGWEPSEPDEPSCEDHDEHDDDCDDCAIASSDWLDACRDEATSAVNEVELP